MPNPFSQVPSKPFGIQSISAGVKPGPTGPMPPALANLQHWYDFTDESTVWADANGTIPATNGSNILRVDNKGNEVTVPFLNTIVVQAMEYRTNVINGLAVCHNEPPTQADIVRTQAGNQPGATGLSLASVGRRLANPAASELISWNWSTTWIDPQEGPVTWASREDAAVILDSGKTVLINEWVWCYATYVSNNFNIRAAGEAEVNDNGFAYIRPADGQRIGIFISESEYAECLAWDIDLSPAETTDLILYFDEKYGAMPF